MLQMKDSNLVMSYTVKEDRTFTELGYKFLGCSYDKKGNEVHIFQKESLARYKARMKKIEKQSRTKHPDLMK